MCLAYQALVVEGGMKKGDNVLIHAVSFKQLPLTFDFRYKDPNVNRAHQELE
jgi:hypothetical protein